MKILFLCVANSARSQMAEGLGRHLLGEDALVASAGSRPGSVNPIAIEVMAEIGIEISQHYSKSVSGLDLSQFETVITLCAEEVCPIAIGSFQRLHWPLPDPAQAEGGDVAMKEQFRQVRDHLRDKIAALLDP